ncbi:MAG TPA: hypothetical protein VMR66_02905 [Gemmatimonadota bacterium]|nr:hypothetical protein [Gemmatimonadota bacterium]
MARYRSERDGSRTGAPAVDFRFLMTQVLGEPRDRKEPPERLIARRDERVRSIVRLAFESVPWYRRALRERGIDPGDVATADDLWILPVVQHEDLAAEPEAFLPRGTRIEDLLELRTSGSTMIPRRIFHDSEGMIAGWAVKLRERAVREAACGGRPRRSASISMDGNPTAVREHFRVIAPAVWKLIPGRRQVSVFDDIARVSEELAEYRPDHLSGYGSAIGRLFRHLAETGVRFPLPRLVTFSSDALAPGERRLIEDEFGVPVLGVYGATEAFSIGFECGEGEGYHINEDVSHVRIVDAEGRDAAEGEPGSLLLSNLVNRGTVLLNYTLGDVAARLAGPCPCGRSLPRIRLLEGRDATFIERPGLPPVHQYRLIGPLKELPTSRWQVAQEGPHAFTVRVIPLGGHDPPSLEAAIHGILRETLGPGLEVRIEYPSDLERTARGKVPFFVRPRPASSAAPTPPPASPDRR